MLLTASNLGVPHGFGTRNSGESPDVVTGRQVHGDRIVLVTGAITEQCDALVTQTAGLSVGVLTADCVPVLIADRERRAVAAVHSGWRGTAARIAAKTVEYLSAELGIAPEGLSAALGPAVGGCCYEVSREVANAVRGVEAVGETGAVLGADADKVNIDLRHFITLQLEAAGVSNVESVGECTICHPGDYFSYRREGKAAGRHVSFISL